MEETQERSLHHAAIKMEIAARPTPFADLDPETRLRLYQFQRTER